MTEPVPVRDSLDQVADELDLRLTSPTSSSVVDVVARCRLVVLRRGDALVRAQQTDEAFSEAARALDRAPLNAPYVEHLKANLIEAAGRWADAADELDRYDRVLDAALIVLARLEAP